VHRSIVISDNTDEITASLNEASARSNIIIMTGGLGPTKDDITKHTLVKYFNTSLRFDEEVHQQQLARGASCAVERHGPVEAAVDVPDKGGN
jgi:molybdopterin-biosynthesis enzyme MoeA-like protein